MLRGKVWLRLTEVGLLLALAWVAINVWFGWQGSRLTFPEPPSNRIEVEALVVTPSRKDIKVEMQDTINFHGGRWGGDKHMFFTGTKVGDYFDVEVPGPELPGQILYVHLTTANDYAKFRVIVDGEEVQEVDLYSRFIRTKKVALKVARQINRPTKVRFEVSGRNPVIANEKNNLGIDYFVYEYPKSDNSLLAE